jgi:hypothetical protein
VRAGTAGADRAAPGPRRATGTPFPVGIGHADRAQGIAVGRAPAPRGANRDDFTGWFTTTSVTAAGPGGPPRSLHLPAYCRAGGAAAGLTVTGGDV